MRKVLLVLAFLFTQIGNTQPLGFELNSVFKVDQENYIEPSDEIKNDNDEYLSFHTEVEDIEYLNDIEYIEKDEETIIDFGFDHKKYLPSGFDPHLPNYNINSILFVEESIDINFGFDLKKYLPRGFDPHLPSYNINSILFIEEEIDIDLEFDYKRYLPEGFDPYTK